MEGVALLYAQGLKALRHWNFCVCQLRAKIKTKYFTRTQNALENEYVEYVELALAIYRCTNEE